jgi:hypothetical protein
MNARSPSQLTFKSPTLEERRTMNMKPTLTLLTALLLASLAALHARQNMPGVPRLGILRAGSFQALETFDATASNDWN